MQCKVKGMITTLSQANLSQWPQILTMEESYEAEKIPSSHSPREYWEDSKWANDHFADIVKDYANLWVAIVDQKIVAVGKVISVVRKSVQEQTGRKHFPVIFAEKGIHVSQANRGKSRWSFWIKSMCLFPWKSKLFS